MMIKNALLLSVFVSFFHCGISQDRSSSRIFHQIKKLSVFGSVLYIAAHPDDENTRLLSYLSNEKLYRTGYLSLTRGDGGQNLIGDEQGVELGMIRTYELLAARKVDGAEQFFTRAYDFGYSKRPEEALKIWGHDKILSDVVWAIRSFRPDVIICRFPTTGEGGHGHHTASAILAAEAFDAAGDPARFPGQLSNGVTVWKPKRLLWNTFNFGNNNTQREDQFKLDVGMYNSLLGTGYGEMAAESRSKHSSQGFGVPAQRGSSLEYFATIKGTPPSSTLFDGINVSASRLKFANAAQEKTFAGILSLLETAFNFQAPQQSVPVLLNLLSIVNDLPEQEDRTWKTRYSSQLTELIVQAGGIFTEVVSGSQFNVLGDSAAFTANFVNRAGLNVSNIDIRFAGAKFSWAEAPLNTLLSSRVTVSVPMDMPRGNPFWLDGGLPNGSFTIDSQALRTAAVLHPHLATVTLTISGHRLHFTTPVRYKYVEPTKGEIYQPVYFIDAVNISAEPSLEIRNTESGKVNPAYFGLKFNKAINGKVTLSVFDGRNKYPVFDSLINVKSGTSFAVPFTANGSETGIKIYRAELTGSPFAAPQVNTIRQISYSHIPQLVMQHRDSIKVVSANFSISGSRIGYIKGAGDKVPEALKAMGYAVDFLEEPDVTESNLAKYDAIVTGIRAFNVHNWLETVHPVLMNYVKNGGVMLVQYNTNSNVGPLRSRISPYPFSISRLRVTDESAEVHFNDPNHPVLNYPNKISSADFEGWIQERSVYHAEKIDPAFKKILSMKDPGEQAEEGSLIIAEFGSGRYIYTGLSFFRQLPAGVPGAYRLLANLLAKPSGKN